MAASPTDAPAPARLPTLDEFRDAVAALQAAHDAAERVVWFIRRAIEAYGAVWVFGDALDSHVGELAEMRDKMAASLPELDQMRRHPSGNEFADEPAEAGA